MSIAGIIRSSGPEREVNVTPVHIVLIEEPISICDDGTPTAIGLAMVHKHIGGHDALSPTDVVVFNGRPWHMVCGIPKHHPEVHVTSPETVLRLSRKAGERASWWSERPFTIDTIALAHGHGHEHGGAPPPYPFAERSLRTAQTLDRHGRAIFIARSVVPVEGAVGHTYKVTFTIGGQAIDPDMFCAP